MICLVPATLTGVEIGCHIDLVSTACAHISVKCWRCRRAGIVARVPSLLSKKGGCARAQHDERVERGRGGGGGSGMSGASEQSK